MILCFDIGGSYIKAGLSSPDGELRPIGRVATPGNTFQAFVDALDCFLGRHRATRLIAIAIAGVIDPRTGVIRCANIACIDGRSLAADLEAALAVRVVVANDGDCFALAEAGCGVGRGHRIVFGAILGTGVGGGLVIDNRLLQGAGGLTGEWGHGPVADRLPDAAAAPVPRFACGCGQIGCIDTVGGARGLERLHGALHGRALVDGSPPGTSHEILDSWAAGDVRAERTVSVYCDLVSAALSLVINTIGASIVPVGGGLGSAPSLVARLDVVTRSRILRRQTEPLVVPGRCVQNPGLIGAGLLGWQNLA